MLSADDRKRALTALKDPEVRADDEVLDLVQKLLLEKSSLGPEAVTTGVNAGAEILRDERGIPHIRAENPYDLFFAHGYAQAQDRLWQLDYLRRQGQGQLSEVFGEETLKEDILSRTLGITEISRGSLDVASAESRDALQAFADGVNAWIELLPAGLPIEFELLEYEPSPWEPVDSFAILNRWYWYLTGRLPVVSLPEVVRASIGDLESAFFQPDGETEYIVPSGSYDPTPAYPDLATDPLREPLWGVPDPIGSNNWAIAPRLAKDGVGMVGSDPHVYYTVPADWYDVHLHGAGYDVVGMTYPGVPMPRFGRNQSLAWGITNNICLQRDLYVERVNPDNAGEYLHGDSWVPFNSRSSTIEVRDADPVDWTTRFSHGRPIVDHLVDERMHPANVREDDEGTNTALSLAWVGFEPTDGPQVLLDLSKSRTVDEGRKALKNWRCPTWNFVLADTEGAVAYQCTGAIPLRGRESRGYRDANDPADAWRGYIPYEGLPTLVDPDRGWVASSNNPTAPPDFPYPLYGTWAVEDRAARAATLLEEYAPHDTETFEKMQNDVLSGRAQRGVPGVLEALSESSDDEFADIAGILGEWDCKLDVESIGGAVFYVFFWKWHGQVVQKRFSPDRVPLVMDAGWGLSSALLHENQHDWFDDESERQQSIKTAMREAMSWLRETLGESSSDWQWGQIHRLGAVHPAARTPLQHELLDVEAEPQPGGAGTLSSAFYRPPGTFDAKIGPSYRMIAELDDGATTYSVTWPGHSGHPGSPHYRDQVHMHKTGHYGQYPFDWDDVVRAANQSCVLEPA